MIILKNVKIHFVFSVIFIFSLNITYAQQRKELGIIKGTVYDQRNCEFIDSINIIVKGTYCGTISDSLGRYTIDRIPPGQYSLHLVKMATYNFTVDSVQVISTQTINHDIFIPNICDSWSEDAIKDTTKGFVRFRVSGLLVQANHFVAFTDIYNKYGYDCIWIGCESSFCEDAYNKIAEKYLDNRNGKGWLERLNKEISERIKIIK